MHAIQRNPDLSRQIRNETGNRELDRKHQHGEVPDPFTEKETIRVRKGKRLPVPYSLSGLKGTDLLRLPTFAETKSTHHHRLYIEKLRQCSVLMNFAEPFQDMRNKEYKQETLKELIIFTGTRPSILNQSGMIVEFVNMVSSNIFRPRAADTGGQLVSPEGDNIDEPALEPAWPHLQLVYHFLFRVLDCPELDIAKAKLPFNYKFVLELLELFNSEDVRERECVKVILHRMYGRFFGLRSYIRKHVGFVLLRFVYEEETFHGISELLEVYGSIVNGFTTPLKDEHVQFLLKILLPLHKTHAYTNFAGQLTYCIAEYIRKEQSLLLEVVTGLLKMWPRTSSRKEVLYFAELEEILRYTSADKYKQIQKPLLRQLAKSLHSDHFQVAERCLFLLTDKQCLRLTDSDLRKMIPIIYPGILSCLNSFQWNPIISRIAEKIKLYMEALDAQGCSRASANENRIER